MFLVILIVLLILFYFYAKKKSKYWEERNVKYIQPLPFIGNLWKSVLGLEPFAEALCDIYNKFPNERYIGGFTINFKTMLFIRDPDLIKQITVKDFDIFPEHRLIVDEDDDPLWGKNLFSSREQSWRKLRPTLSPAFTSSKMKMMYGLIKECSEEFVNYYLENEEEIITINSKQAFRKYTNDVIATAAFGVKCNSFKDPNNEFFIMGKDATDIRGLRLIKFFFGPKVNKFFKVKIFSKKVRDFFTNLVKETIELRESKGIIRPDMIHLLMEARKGTIKDDASSIDTGFATVEENYTSSDKKKIDLSNDEIAAQALIFFIAGFDTSSTLMSYVLHELAVNPDIQEKLRNEIDDINEECASNITYEKLMKMKYLDMVLCETLRKWPPTIIADRINLKDYTIQASRPDESDVHLSPNSNIGIPTFALHRDPKYFPEPEKFDPERFNDENKHKIHPFAYIPFGSGPRNCIGSRFALMEAKLIIYHIVKEFHVEVVDKTPIPIKLSPEFNLIPIGGLWVGLKKRNQK